MTLIEQLFPREELDKWLWDPRLYLWCVYQNNINWIIDRPFSDHSARGTVTPQKRKHVATFRLPSRRHWSRAGYPKTPCPFHRQASKLLPDATPYVGKRGALSRRKDDNSNGDCVIVFLQTPHHVAHQLLTFRRFLQCFTIDFVSCRTRRMSGPRRALRVKRIPVASFPFTAVATTATRHIIARGFVVVAIASTTTAVVATTILVPRGCCASIFTADAFRFIGKCPFQTMMFGYTFFDRSCL